MRVAIISNPHKPNAVSVVSALLKKYSPGERCSFLLDEVLSNALGCKELYRSDKDMSNEADLLIVLGGDGTLLHAVRRITRPGLPVLGVNFGGLGFLTEFTPDEFLQAFGEILHKNYTVDERMTLKVQVLQKGAAPKKFEVLNDAVVTKRALARMLNLDVAIGENYLTTYRADGLIVATPTGSTAHSLSGGGPIVAPNSEVMVLTPICPHTLSNRPLVLSNEEKLRIQLAPGSEMVGLTLDGQVNVELNFEDQIEIEKGERKIPLIRYKSHYFDVLRRKLGWKGSA